MKTTRTLATLFAALLVSSGIGVAVAQSATPSQPPAPETDSGAVTPQTQVAAAPGSVGSSSSMQSTSEPAPQATRG